MTQNTGGRRPEKELEAAEALWFVHWFLTVYTAVYASSAWLFRNRDGDIAAPSQPALLCLALIIAFLLALLCHMLPSRLASRHRKSFQRVLLPLGRFLAVILKPILAPLRFLAGVLSRLFGGDRDTVGGGTEEEIRKLVDAVGEKGGIEKTEKEMINNVFEFNNTSVDEICVHRKDIFALPVTATINEAVRAAAMGRYSRIPVFEGSIDNIVGILHIKDIFKIILEQSPETETEDGFELTSVLHKPYFVPLSMTTSSLFAEMQKNKVHIAIIVDEYGGTAGLVTMEDLIEEIMGNIQDEYDEEERPPIRHIAGNAYEVDGGVELDAAAEFFGCPLPVDDYDTLGGFLIGQLGRVPTDGDQPQLEYEGLLFKVYRIIDRRIEVVIVCKL